MVLPVPVLNLSILNNWVFQLIGTWLGQGLGVWGLGLDNCDHVEVLTGFYIESVPEFILSHALLRHVSC